MNNKLELLNNLHNGAIVITPNNRLSDQLLNDYYNAFINSKKSIAKPQCMPYKVFIEDLYKKLIEKNQFIEHPKLLSNNQQRYLWQTIFKYKKGYPLNRGLLDKICEAWSRCQIYNVNINDPLFTTTEQTSQFQSWQIEYIKHLEQLSAITIEQLVNYILKFPVPIKNNSNNRLLRKLAVDSKCAKTRSAEPQCTLVHEDSSNESTKHFDATVEFPKKSNKVIWACFDDLTPAQLNLQQYLENYGFTNTKYDIEKNLNIAQIFSASDKQDEYAEIFKWIKTRPNNESIAVVVPSLEKDVNLLKRLFKKNLPNQEFNISFGKKLTEFPLIAEALQLIALNPKTITKEQLLLLLNSEYLDFNQNERISQFELINNKKLFLTNTIELESAIQEIKPYSPKLSLVLSAINAYPNISHPMDFVIVFKKRLEALGFLQNKLLDSPGYQCLQRLMLLFDEFQELAFINNNMSLNDAILALNDLAQNSIFQLNQPSTNINILGILEASGTNFDNIWVCDLTDKSLPNQTNFSAFIPIELQKNLSMPHTSLNRELEFAKKQLERFQYCANNTVFSFAKYIDDMPMIICPLIKHLPEYEPITLPSKTNEVALIEYFEDYLVPIQPNETINGGTSLLANQAKCPFKAFASMRLHASEILSDNQSAIIRGQIMHKVMELIWKELKTQENLLNQTQSSLNNLIKNAITETLQQFKLTDNESLENISNIVEIDRLSRLVNIALNFDMLRPKFQIAALEEKFSITLAGIDFKVRVDRIDKTNQNQKLVIDYKSSLPISLPWLEDRPDEPQLLLYALLDNDIFAITYMQLTSAKITPKGISYDDIMINGIKYDSKLGNWEDLKQKWSLQLTNLALEFKSGLIHPKPSKEYICTQCSFQNLCRKSIA